MTEQKTTATLLNTKPGHDRTENRHEHYWKTEQHFYHRIQNWHEHDWKTQQHFYDGTLNRTQLHFGESKTYENVCKLFWQGWMILWSL